MTYFAFVFSQPPIPKCSFLPKKDDVNNAILSYKLGRRTYIDLFIYALVYTFIIISHDHIRVTAMNGTPSDMGSCKLVSSYPDVVYITLFIIDALINGALYKSYTHLPSYVSLYGYLAEAQLQVV